MESTGGRRGELEEGGGRDGRGRGRRRRLCEENQEWNGMVGRGIGGERWSDEDKGKRNNIRSRSWRRGSDTANFSIFVSD